MTTLRYLQPGQKAVITKIKAPGEMNRRLRDMGLVPGTEFEVHGRAPLYDPVNIKVRGNNLSLRNNEADYIFVQTEDENPPQQIKIALAGNPNAGKSSLFNRLTGARAHVGNFPGITVARKEGVFEHAGHTIGVTDLPGAYSLTAYSPEELVARQYVLDERPDLVVMVVDAANLERNLYLALQYMETGAPLVIALNMMDVARDRGLSIDHHRLAELLGAPVAPTVARSNQGLGELMQTIVDTALSRPRWEPLKFSYGADLDEKIAALAALFEQGAYPTAKYPARWLAIKALEGDEKVLELAQTDEKTAPSILKLVKAAREHARLTLDETPEGLIADYRYGFIASVVKQAVTSTLDQRRNFSDLADRALLSRLVGPLFLLGIIYLIYQFVFVVSTPLVDGLSAAFSWLGRGLAAALPEGLLSSLLVSGVIDGVGGVLQFTPLIFCMFFAIAILEDSGYMARVAFIMDRVLRTFGLHGNSVLSLIISGGVSGGCAVPGVLAARTLRDPKERLATILTAPLMNCGAKLPVLALLTAAFFAGDKALMLFLLTLLSWVFVLLSARILRWTILRGDHTPFVMELPPYRLPTMSGLMIHTWERTWQYVKKAGTIILAVSILLWAVMTFPGLPQEREDHYAALAERAAGELVRESPASAFLEGETDLARLKALMAGQQTAAPAAVTSLANAYARLENTPADETDTPLGQAALAVGDYQRKIADIEGLKAREALRDHSLAGTLGKGLETITRPLGFDWRIDIALLGGFAAKEVIISTLGTAYSLGAAAEENPAPLAAKMRQDSGLDRVTALALIIFIMLYSPCFATLITIGRETGGIVWPLFTMAYTTGLAYVSALAVAKIGGLLF